MELSRWQNLPAMFFDQAQKFGPKPFVWVKKDGAYQPLSWAKVADAVLRLAGGLENLGLDKGDRVVLVSENRPEWLIADLAIMTAGGISVPAYITNTSADHEHILTNSGARGALVSTTRLARSMIPACDKAEACEFLITMEKPDVSAHSTHLYDWATIQEAGSADPSLIDALKSYAADDLACFIYTSGTGGVPKGVMLSHKNILSNCVVAHDLLEELGLEAERFLSFLPLSHSYEHTAGQFFPIAIGAQIFYAESVEQLMSNMGEVKPTIMTAVPRLYESMHQRILRGLAKEKPLKQKLFHKTVTLGQKRLSGGHLGPIEKLQDRVLEKLVRDKIRTRFGGELKAMVSGGAALNPEIGFFFSALGLRILQGYGLTESSPVIAANRPGKIKMETVGPPVKGVEVKIAEDGEILARGDLVMQGYWGDEDATQAVIQDGWLHTGDVGVIDADGYITITDRKKDIVVLSGGDNVSPQRIEGILTLEPEIAQAMVVGDKRPHLAALIVADADWVKSEALDPAELKKAMAGVMERVNKKLSNLEKVRRFHILDQAFTTDNGMLTPTMKIRRHKIREAFGAEIDALYG